MKFQPSTVKGRRFIFVLTDRIYCGNLKKILKHMDRSMLCSLLAMFFGVGGIVSAVVFKDIKFFLGGIALAIIAFSVAPSNSRKPNKTQ